MNYPPPNPLQQLDGGEAEMDLLEFMEMEMQRPPSLPKQQMSEIILVEVKKEVVVIELDDEETQEIVDGTRQESPKPCRGHSEGVQQRSSKDDDDETVNALQLLQEEYQSQEAEVGEQITLAEASASTTADSAESLGETAAKPRRRLPEWMLHSEAELQEVHWCPCGHS